MVSRRPLFRFHLLHQLEVLAHVPASLCISNKMLELQFVTQEKQKGGAQGEISSAQHLATLTIQADCKTWVRVR